MDTASPAPLALFVPSPGRLVGEHDSSSTHATSPDLTARRLRRRGAMVVATFALLVTACGGGPGTPAAISKTSPAPAMHLVNGTVSVFTGGGGCSLVTRTVGAGAEVVVYAQELTILATTRLGTGYSGRLETRECNFPFRATLPTTSSYLFSIGDQLNLAVTKTKLRHNKWSVIINSPNIV